MHIWLTVLSLLTALIGIITPTISQSLYDTYIPLGAKNVLLQLGSFAASFMIANVMLLRLRRQLSLCKACIPSQVRNAAPRT